MKDVLKMLIPGVIMLVLVLMLRDILIGIYILFPLLFVIQGASCSNSKMQLIIGFLVTSVAFIIPINIFYKMGNCIDLLIVYIFLGLVSFYIKKVVGDKHVF